MDIEAIGIERFDREALRRLLRRSDARGLLQLGTHVALIGATGTLVWASRGRAWWIPALVAHGVAISFLFCALHESVHRTAFASRWISDLVARVCGAVLLLPPEYFRQFHFAHHRFTQDPGRDPELAVPAPASRTSYWWRLSGLPYWRDRLSVTLRHALIGRVTESCIAPAYHGAVIREARLLWALYLCVAGLSRYLQRADALIYWAIPLLLGQPFLRGFLLAEHAGCAFSDDMLANTRTTYTSAATRWLTWRMSFHAEHHCFPGVPFHALAAVNCALRGRLQVSAPGYLALHRELLRHLGARGPAPARSAPELAPRDAER
jgi:fatty acid desaturase